MGNRKKEKQSKPDNFLGKIVTAMSSIRIDGKQEKKYRRKPQFTKTEMATNNIKTITRDVGRAKYKGKANRHSVIQSLSKKTLPYYEIETSNNKALGCIKGIVVPSGHGKSSMCRLEGWIDIDSLVCAPKLAELRSEAYDRMENGYSFTEAFEPINQMAKKTLNLLQASKNTILLAHSFESLITLGIDIAGAVCLSEEVLNDNVHNRSELEREVARANREKVLSYRDGPIDIFEAGDQSELLWYIYSVCDVLNIETGAPRDFEMELPSYMPDHIGRGTKVELDELIKLYECGKSTKAIVDYQVNLEYGRPYRGFGFNMNDWAKAASVVTSTSNFLPNDSDWIPKPLSIEKLSKEFDLSEHKDILDLISIHGKEHERFIISVVSHWKAIGCINNVSGKLYELYKIKRIFWPSVFQKIRHGVLNSNELFGTELTISEREVLLNMHVLSVGNRRQLVSRLTDKRVAYPSKPISNEMLEGTKKQILELKFDVADMTAEARAWGELVLCNAKISLKKETVKDHVLYGLWYELTNRWHGTKGGDLALKSILKRVNSDWYLLASSCDEWTEGVRNILSMKCDNSSIGHSVGAMLSCNLEDEAAHEEWSMKVCRAIKGFIVCGIIIGNDKAKIMMEQTPYHVKPSIVGITEKEIWRRIAKSKIPKGALDYLDYNGNNYFQHVMELNKWKNSSTIMIMEMINVRSWLPDAKPIKYMSILYNWLVKGRCGMVDVVYDSMINMHYKLIYGCDSSKERLEAFKNLDHIGQSCGGLGLMDHINLKQIWDGKRNIKLSERHEYRPKNTVSSENLDKACYNFNSYEWSEKYVSSKSLALGGLVYNILTNCTSKESMLMQIEMSI
ncbi:hypothetical protein KM773_s3gp1 [Chrysothrix chrysovirus 1]|uniref:RNA-directed RNA polymerase n=1 Tax=Chrysothrix chrysovirus 1 TaxID=2682569 RepID=A0A650D8A7_9VIRU|nr:hypothetical protein KM773_s3gp1 [Chrysothrix chrysovirus 1]QGR26540.1 hypothetical protein [Chrysothrix chrysovirus 1]